MSRLSTLSIAFYMFAAGPSAVSGFTLFNSVGRASTELSAVGNSSRRNFLSAATGSALVAGAAGTAALPAWAEISEGTSLPQGAQQFSTMIRVKGDLKVCYVNVWIAENYWRLLFFSFLTCRVERIAFSSHHDNTLYSRSKNVSRTHPRTWMPRSGITLVNFFVKYTKQETI